MDVYLETIIGKRIYFKDLSSRAYDFVIPDTATQLSFWRRMWRDGSVHEGLIHFSESEVFLEIDRATNPITRLEDRIKKYGKIWRGLSGNPAQAWVAGLGHRWVALAGKRDPGNAGGSRDRRVVGFSRAPESG
ncbi:MAG: hypothetical protein R6U51_08285 [Anaerolineales bacterium]